MTAIAFILLAGTVTFLAHRLYETREQVRQLRQVVRRLVDATGALVDIATEDAP